ncbi:hypothetical protein GCM10011591_04690 [Nocardia camponoti]|uniref:Uncharacterized protein n=1 Tax=Nocardia camponoti TaxID=1616106 RepID=A0A917Q8L2_9NOCA|nr:hypothetical protein GCM10011591_04690 [Nocardia camponoti]
MQEFGELAPVDPFAPVVELDGGEFALVDVPPNGIVADTHQGSDLANPQIRHELTITDADAEQQTISRRICQHHLRPTLRHRDTPEGGESA